MQFFLLGKGPEDDLRLISPHVFASRKAALAELSTLTSDAAFAHWDADVFVVTLDEAAEVLLVRPATAAAAEPEPEQEAELDEEAFVEEAEPEATEEDEQPEVEPDDNTESNAAEEAEDEPAEQETESEDEPAESESEPEEEPDVSTDALSAVVEGLEDETSAEDTESAPDTTTEEAEAETPAEVDEVDAAWAEAVEQTTEDESVSLKEALARTAAQLESEGIVAPESVGPEAIEPQVEPETAPEQEAEGEEPAGGWPWATGGDAKAEEPAFSLDALEEPALDESGGSLIRAKGDDDAMAAARPVILGSYDEPAVETVAEPMSASEAEAVAMEAEAVIAVEPETIDEVAQSDFILDLDDIAPLPNAAPASVGEPVEVEPVAVETEPAAEVAAIEPEPAIEAEVPVEPEPSADDIAAAVEQLRAGGDPSLDAEAAPEGYRPGGSLDGLTCGDCVYVLTCQYKDQRIPATCVSFQWK